MLFVDESPSQRVGRREQQNRQTLSELQKFAESHKNLELRIVRAKVGNTEKDNNGTHLFSSLSQAIADVPRNQLSSVVLITDGQVHDIPKLDREKGARPLFFSACFMCF